jgi:hypothetical protein
MIGMRYTVQYDIAVQYCTVQYYLRARPESLTSRLVDLVADISRLRPAAALLEVADTVASSIVEFRNAWDSLDSACDRPPGLREGEHYSSLFSADRARSSAVEPHNHTAKNTTQAYTAVNHEYRSGR